jgi:hypothetical protein
MTQPPMEFSNKRTANLCLDILEIWTALLAAAASFVAVFWPVWLLLAAPPTWAFAAKWALFALLLCGFGVLHWLLLDRVNERRRWACLASVFLGILYLFPPASWISPGPWQVVAALLLGGLMACVLAAWDRLVAGW